MAIPFALGVRTPGTDKPEILTGVFTRVAVGLDQPGGRRDRTWCDLGMSRSQAEEQLRDRLYQLKPA